MLMVVVMLEIVVDSVDVELFAAAGSELPDETVVGRPVVFVLTVVLPSVARVVVDGEEVLAFLEETLDSAEVSLVTLLDFPASDSSVGDSPESSATGEDCFPSSDPDFSAFVFFIVFSASTLVLSLR